MINRLKPLAIKTTKVALILLAWFGLVFTVGNISDLELKSKLPFLGSKHVYTGGWNEGYFTFKGTWDYGDSKDDIFFNEINTVSGQCWLPNKTCAVATASFNNGSLFSGVEVFDIVRWDKDVISMEIDNTCIKTIVTATRSTESVTSSEIGKTGENCNPKHRVNMTLLDGYDVYKKIRNRDQSTATSVLIIIVSLIVALTIIIKIIRKKPDEQE